MHNKRMNCNDLFVVISEDTAANAPQRNAFIAGAPGAVSCIQFRKLTFIYVFVCITACEDEDTGMKLLLHQPMAVVQEVTVAFGVQFWRLFEVAEYLLTTSLLCRKCFYYN